MTGILFQLVAILVGIVAAASFLVGKMPTMKEKIEQLQTYQAGIGAAGAVVGILTFADLLSGGTLRGSAWLIAFVTSISMLAVGLVLGYPLLQSIFLDDLSESSRNKAEEIKNMLAPFQILGGLIALGGGVILFLYKFM